MVSTGPTTGGGAASAAAVPANAAPASSRPVKPHNDADIQFANTMIPQHVQALASSQIASSKATKPQVKSIAATISKTQVPEIEALSAWLTSWGQPVPAGGVASGKQGSSGLTQGDLTQLAKTTGSGFDSLWLNTMIKHQQSAVTLAQAEVTNGSSAEAKELAKKIIAAQGAQIATMKGLLGKA